MSHLEAKSIASPICVHLSHCLSHTHTHTHTHTQQLSQLPNTSPYSDALSFSPLLRFYLFSSLFFPHFSSHFFFNLLYSPVLLCLPVQIPFLFDLVSLLPSSPLL